MSKQEDEESRVHAIARSVKAEAKKHAESESVFSGCCYITTTGGQRQCFDWDGLGEEECKKIGTQSGSAWQFVPGATCQG